MRRIAAVVISVFSLVCCFTRPLLAQEGSASLTGFIQDSSKAVIPGVKVTAIDTNTNQHFEATSSKDGSYTIVSLPVGPYQIEVEKPGFKTILKDDLFLHTQDALQVNFQMAVGSTSETVTVNGSATNDSPAVSMTVSRDFVENMPLNGRSFQDLIALAPGTVTQNPSLNGAGQFSIDGQRATANSSSVDGVSANLSPATAEGNESTLSALAGIYPAQTALGTSQALASVDALQEFTIQTSGYSAEYGRQPGGQIEITTRSGTDDFHGTLFDYFRNTVLDANDWFSNLYGTPRGPMRQNDFGGTLGGPLIIPRVYDGKQRSFFFISYEGLRLLLPHAVDNFYVPTAELRQFAAPAIQPLLNSLPVPNGAALGDQCAAPIATFSCTATWSGSFSSPDNIDSTSVRIDENMGKHFKLFGRFAYTPSSTGGNNPQLVSEYDTTHLNTKSLTLGLTATLSDRLLDELRVNYSTSGQLATSRPDAIGGAVPYGSSLLIPAQYSSDVSVGFGSISLPNEGGNGSFSPPNYEIGSSTQEQSQFQLVNGVSWTRGQHALKFGVDYRRLFPDYNVDQYQFLWEIQTLSSLQNGIADFARPTAEQPAHPIFDNLSVYAQDQWKPSRRLAIDAGLRWEFNPVPGASDGLYPLALTTSNLATAEIAPTGTPQYHTVYHDFAPRVGLSYVVRQSTTHPTVVRAAGGVFYDTGQANAAVGYQGYPFYNFAVYNNAPFPLNVTPPSSGIHPLNPPYNPITGVSVPNLQLPYTIQWNTTIDQQLTSHDVLNVSYVGNIGRDLLFTQGYGQCCTPLPLNRNFTVVDVTSNAATSNYNALQVKDQGTVVPSLHLIASYTLGRAIDTASESGGAAGPMKGNSDNDVRHVLNLAIDWGASSAKTGNPFVNALLNGWRLDQRFTAESGYAFSILQSEYSVPDNNQQIPIYPDLVAGARIYLHNVPNTLGGWGMNSAAFSLVPLNADGSPVVQGNAGRNLFHGPPFWNLNTAIQRTFPLFRETGLDFRAEAFNSLNHPNAGAIDNFIGDSTFGEAYTASTIGVGNSLYSTGSPRSLQLMLRIRF